jgi:hypothetical protein
MAAEEAMEVSSTTTEAAVAAGVAVSNMEAAVADSSTAGAVEATSTAAAAARADPAAAKTVRVVRVAPFTPRFHPDITVRTVMSFSVRTIMLADARHRALPVSFRRVPPPTTCAGPAMLTVTYARPSIRPLVTTTDFVRIRVRLYFCAQSRIIFFMIQ